METIRKARKLRLYPTEAQKQQLAVNFGCSRWIYNYFLRLKTDLYASEKRSLSYPECSKIIPSLKGSEDTGWLREANSQVLQQSLKDLHGAYDAFFDKRSKHPRFKDRRGKQSIRFPQNISVRSGSLHLPLLQKVKTGGYLPDIDEVIKSATVSMEHGKYFVSISVEAPAPDKMVETNSVVGIDLGLSTFLTTSDGDKIDNPKWLRKAERKLRKANKILSRRKKGSARHARARQRVSRQHESVKNRRKDFHHKLSTALIRENQVTVVEDLSIKGMVRTNLSKSVSDAGWGQFIRMLEYKAQWYGRSVEKIDRWFPSSKRCHCCGWVNEHLRLKDRNWECQQCGEAHDRDVNAAKNILQFSTVGSTGINARGDLALAGSLNRESPCGEDH